MDEEMTEFEKGRQAGQMHAESNPDSTLEQISFGEGVSSDYVAGVKAGFEEKRSEQGL